MWDNKSRVVLSVFEGKCCTPVLQVFTYIYLIKGTHHSGNGLIFMSEIGQPLTKTEINFIISSHDNYGLTFIYS